MAENKPNRSLSVLKRARQNTKRQLRNRAYTSKIKTLTKHVLSAIDSGKTENLSEIFKATVKSIDVAAAKGALHRNTASRKVARLSKIVGKAL